jgi:hypothetical protein
VKKKCVKFQKRQIFFHQIARLELRSGIIAMYIHCIGEFLIFVNKILEKNNEKYGENGGFEGFLHKKFYTLNCKQSSPS